jgi:hypothetical protein
MAQILDNLILENYDSFVKEHTTLFEEARTPSEILFDDSYFDMYVSQLTKGLEESAVDRIVPVLDRERKMFLEEHNSLLSSPEAIAYAVTTFPMLINIYAEPQLSKIVTTYPSDVPTLSISRIKWVSKVIDEQGGVTEYMFPTATEMVRPNFKQFTVAQSANLYAELGIAKGDFRLSKRNFKVTAINVVVDDGTTQTPVEVPVIGIAGARGNFTVDDFTVEGVTGGVYKLQGSVDFESGSITWSVITLETGDKLVTAENVEVKFRLFGNGNGRGVVKSAPKQDIIDVNADIEDSFEVENIEEVIQDWSAIYKLDIISELKNFVKQQIKLNRDYEIADLLESNIPFATSIGQYKEIDFGQFTQTGGFKPSNVQDVFKNIVPTIMSLVEKMRKTNNMEVQYLACGVDVAVILKSLQEFSVKFEKMNGETGVMGTVGGFNKLEIIESYAINDDLMHLVLVAPAMNQSSIVEVLFKPLYIITETTNSIRRTFIKSRTWIGIVRSEGIGTIRLKGYDAWVNV